MTKIEMSQAIRNQPCGTLWYAVRNRCYNTRAANYKDYGGRGITMQESWLLDFGAFQSYVMALENYDKRESENYSLDRIDNDHGYEEGNLRWASKTEQAMNRRKSKPRAKQIPRIYDPKNNRENRQAKLVARLSEQLFK